MLGCISVNAGGRYLGNYATMAQAQAALQRAGMIVTTQEQLYPYAPPQTTCCFDFNLPAEKRAVPDGALVNIRTPEGTARALSQALYDSANVPRFSELQFFQWPVFNSAKAAFDAGSRAMREDWLEPDRLTVPAEFTGRLT